MNPSLTSLLDALASSADRDAAGRALLDMLQVRVRETLGGLGIIRRSTLHLRPGGAYADLLSTDDARVELVASSTAWSLLSGRSDGVILDVEAELWSPLGEGVVPGRSAAVRWSGATRVSLQGRRTTHIVALPVRTGPALGGMAIVEVDSPRSAGRRFEVLNPIAAELVVLTRLAAPFLATLPKPSTPGRASDPLLPVVGRQMAGVVDTLRAFSGFEETILLRGATGTGKSHLARWCHAQSPRRTGPFVVAHIHAVAEALREGDLFGWRKGAFTGASSDHRGRVAQAEGGTLFIDEIDKLDLPAQGKLLRLLEERQYSVLGEEKDRTADARFIIGTNANLEREVAAGRFLEDLYYRVYVLPVEIPPLRDRSDEIRAWAAHMASAIRGRGPVVMSPEAGAALEGYTWPGNLRQLQSVIVRAVALASMSGADTVVQAEHVFRSLAMEGRAIDPPLLASLRDAAGAFVRANARRRSSGKGPLDLEHATVLRAAVLLEAVRASGDPRQAFIDLGLEARLQGGNHLRTLRREQERVAQLCADLGEPVPPGWQVTEE